MEIEKEYLECLQSYFQSIEEGIESLPQEQQARVFKPCGTKCVQYAALPELRRQFEECGCDLDAQYTKYGRSEFFFADIIERGRVYEIGYPKCFCPLVTAGFAKSAVQCECSRQSIIYTMHDLLPDKEVEVEILKTVLAGDDECRFRMTIK